MIERRDLLRGIAIGAALTASQSVSACSLPEYDDDTWGDKLVSFFRDGDVSTLDHLLHEFTTLVAFDTSFGTGGKLSFEGAAAVRAALVSSRESFTGKGWVEPRSLIDAKIVGSKQQGRMNRIEFLFAERSVTETSCGPDRSEIRVDLYFEAGVYDSGADQVKWGIERLAWMRPLDTERFG